MGCDSDFGYGCWCGSDVAIDVDVGGGGYDDVVAVAAAVLAAAAAAGGVGIVEGC